MIILDVSEDRTGLKVATRDSSDYLTTDQIFFRIIQFYIYLTNYKRKSHLLLDTLYIVLKKAIENK